MSNTPSNSHGRFVWYELMTTEVEAAKAFYVKVVGWSTREASMSSLRYTLFTVGEVSTGGLIKIPLDAKELGAAPRWIGYVSVDDVDTTVNLVSQLGGTVHVLPTGNRRSLFIVGFSVGRRRPPTPAPVAHISNSPEQDRQLVACVTNRRPRRPPFGFITLTLPTSMRRQSA